MQKTEVTNEGVAWFLMGEGYFYLCILRCKKGIGFRMQPMIRVSNTDYALLKPIMKWLELKGIPFHTNKTIPKNPNAHVVYCVTIGRSYRSGKKFLNSIYPYLVGNKRRIVRIMLDFIKRFELPYRARRLNPRQSRERFLRMMKYRDKISALSGQLRGKQSKSKYSYTYFLEYFETHPLPPSIICPYCRYEFFPQKLLTEYTRKCPKCKKRLKAS